MANPRGVNQHGNGRDKPITDEERKQRNRVYQHQAKHRTNNLEPRVRRRVQERCYKWFQENKAGTLERWKNEERAAEAKRIKDGTAKAYTPILGFANAVENCDHGDPKKDRYSIGVTVACSLCGCAMGSVRVSSDQLNELDDMIGGNPPNVVKRTRRAK